MNNRLINSSLLLVSKKLKSQINLEASEYNKTLEESDVEKTSVKEQKKMWEALKKLSSTVLLMSAASLNSKGEKGDIGPRGKRGKQGKQGVQGLTGEKGEKGDLGPRGHKGDRGEQGVIGEQGPPGKDGEVPDLAPYLNKVSKDFESWRNIVNRQLSSIGGGGSTNILQMDDVEFKKRHEIEGDAILIFDSAKNKFVSESFLDILDRLKAELEVQYDRRIDVSGSYTYIGEAAPGTSESSALWRIKRVEDINDEGDTDIIWANGSADFDKQWDQRLTYNYTAS